MFKICTNCNKHLALNNFHKLKNGRFGRHSRCKLCRKIVINTIQKKSPNKLLCHCCKKVKNIYQFYKNKRSSTGHQSYCTFCQKEKMVQSMSKINNYLKLVLKKFNNKNKDSQINIDVNDLLNIYRQQDGLCGITGHKLTHIVDKKQRTDNIWNISILKKNDNTCVNHDDIMLVCNFVYSTKKIYNLNENELTAIYKNINNVEN